jgi:hypothetical protein
MGLILFGEPNGLTKKELSGGEKTFERRYLWGNTDGRELPAQKANDGAATGTP